MEPYHICYAQLRQVESQNIADVKGCTCIVNATFLCFLGNHFTPTSIPVVLGVPFYATSFLYPIRCIHKIWFYKNKFFLSNCLSFYFTNLIFIFFAKGFLWLIGGCILDRLIISECVHSVINFLWWTFICVFLIESFLWKAYRLWVCETPLFMFFIWYLYRDMNCINLVPSLNLEMRVHLNITLI